VRERHNVIQREREIERKDRDGEKDCERDRGREKTERKKRENEQEGEIERVCVHRRGHDTQKRKTTTKRGGNLLCDIHSFAISTPIPRTLKYFPQDWIVGLFYPLEEDEEKRKRNQYKPPNRHIYLRIHAYVVILF